MIYQAHQGTIKESMHLSPGTSPRDFPDREAAAVEGVSLNTHNGTHVGARCVTARRHCRQESDLAYVSPWDLLRVCTAIQSFGGVLY
jgi:hypothetical protein